MPLYRYLARDNRGEAIEGQLEAATSDAVADQLMNGGMTPVDIVVVATREDLGTELRRRLGFERVTLDEMIMLGRQMYTLLHAGVPIIRTIKGLAESSRNPLLSRTLEDVADNLEAGRPLADCLASHPAVFSSLFVSMIQVGEHTGRLDESFLQMARYLEVEKDTRDRIRTALRYPIFVLVAIGVAIGVINLMVIPAFANVFATLGADLPLPTVILLAVSNFSVAYWPHMASLLLIAIAAARAYVRTEAGSFVWDRTKLRIPLVGRVIERATLGRFAYAFSMALKAGVPLIHALGVVARAVDNEFVGNRIGGMRTGIERGETLTRTAITSGLFTPLVIQMIAVGEETGAVGELLEQVSGYYEREVDYDLKRLSAAIEPILITVIGAIVLVLALGVFLPMWDLAGAAIDRG